MLALKEVIKDFQSINKKEKLNMQLIGYIRDTIEPFIGKCKRLFAGTNNVFTNLKDKISKLKTNDMQQLKDEMLSEIDEQMMIKIIYA